uniref:Elongation of very long chain fatty acids protein n=2 Tax=Wuchereria bancrofti TaxID=6293 RepID=A0A1I8EJ93_WUCBA
MHTQDMEERQLYSDFNYPEFEVWRGPAEKVFYAPYNYTLNYNLEMKYWNPVAVQLFFSKHWSTSIYIAIIYVCLIHALQRYQRTRKAWNLRLPLCIWNAILSVFSLIATIRFGEEFYSTLTTRPFVHSVCYSISPFQPAAAWAFAFATSKVVELGDTIFLLMRKKPLIFLHWYHHAVVLIYSWNAAIELTASGRWFIMMNFFVHSIMYAYYSITALGIRLPKLLSMCVTVLQTSQMLVGVLISIVVLKQKLKNAICQQSMDNLALSFAIYSSFAVLFIRYFYDAYMKPKKCLQKKIE